MSEPRLTADEWNPVTTAALRQVRKSVAALLLELPEAVWREHKGVVETAISQMVEDQLAMRAGRDELRALLDTEIAEHLKTGAQRSRYRSVLERVWATLKAWDRGALDGVNIGDDSPSVGFLISRALAGLDGEDEHSLLGRDRAPAPPEAT